MKIWFSLNTDMRKVKARSIVYLMVELLEASLKFPASYICKEPGSDEYE